MTDVFATLTGAVLALAGVLIGGWINARSQRDQWLKDKKYRSCVDLLIQFEPLYNDFVLSRHGKRPDVAWTAWNQALEGVSVVCDAGVVDAAYLVDEAFWRVDWKIRGGEVGQEKWIENRKPLDASRADFLRAARKQVNSRSKQPRRILGRPADSDAMYQQSVRQRGLIAPGRSRDDHDQEPDHPIG